MAGRRKALSGAVLRLMKGFGAGFGYSGLLAPATFTEAAMHLTRLLTEHEWPSGRGGFCIEGERAAGTLWREFAARARAAAMSR